MGQPATQFPTLKKYALTASGKPTQAAIDAYKNDGVVCLDQAFDESWVARGRRAVAAAIRTQSKSKALSSSQRTSEKGRFFYDVFLWKRLPSFREFSFQSPSAELARQVMQSKQLWMYFDMAIVKEPGASARTPWHYDEAYWPVSGTQICNVWIALDHVPQETALRFVLGSHKFTEQYRAVDFFSAESKRGHTQPDPPRWDLEPGEQTIAAAPMAPGDCAILNLRTHHSAPGNLHRSQRRRAICTHWFGDDARYNNKPYECGPNERGENLTHGGSLECATFPRVI